MRQRYPMARILAQLFFDLSDRGLPAFVRFAAECFEGRDCCFGDALRPKIFGQEGDVVAEPIQAFVLDGGDALQHLDRINLRFCRLRCSHRRSWLIQESHGGGIHAEAMEDGAGSVEGQLAVAIDSDDFIDEFGFLGDDLVADLRRGCRNEELPSRLAVLGPGHREKISESLRAFSFCLIAALQPVGQGE
jgi:hypothetical protein